MDPDINEALRSKIDTKLSEEQSESMEGDMVEQELFCALKSTPNGKLPGSDEFSADFYKYVGLILQILLPIT